jgi:broad specificity phosphatase PhoE
MALTIHLVRHGVAEGATGRCIGQTDLALSAEGAAQCTALAGVWTPPADARLVASDLARTRGSMQALCAAWGRDPAAVTHEARLREMDFGAWDGRTWEALEREDGAALGAWMARWHEVAVPGGEGFPDVRTRAAAWLTEVRAHTPDGTTLVAVAHAGSIRALVCHAVGLPLEAAFRLRVDHARVSTLRVRPRARRRRRRGRCRVRRAARAQRTVPSAARSGDRVHQLEHAWVGARILRRHALDGRRDDPGHQVVARLLVVGRHHPPGRLLGAAARERLLVGRRVASHRARSSRSPGSNFQFFDGSASRSRRRSPCSSRETCRKSFTIVVPAWASSRSKATMCANRSRHTASSTWPRTRAASTSS